MHVLTSRENDCRSCYKCIRHCPTKSISFHDGQASIIFDECVLCGRCFSVCPQSCKVIRDDKQKVLDLIKNNRCIASIAPSFSSSYHGVSFESLKKALLELGFIDAEETAIGATIIKKQYDEYCLDPSHDVIISTCCHSINLLIEKHYPSLSNCLAPFLSPMQAHSFDIKKRYPDAKVIFIGPCIAKKDEADRYKNPDCVLTFLELDELFASNNIKVEAKEGTKEEHSKARLFPIEGGILNTMEKSSPSRQYLSFSGMDECIEVLENIAKGDVHNCFIEMSSCEGSCINGPAIEKDKKALVSSILEIKSSAGKLDFKTNEYKKEELTKKFTPISLPEANFSESQIQEVLFKLGKYTKKDELNCASCGYPTCKEKAKAVLMGKANLEMCLPFLMEKAKSFNEDIIENTPNGIVVTDENLDIQLVNPSLCTLLNIKSSDVIGKNIDTILPSELFALALGNVPTRCAHITLEKYNLFVEASISYDSRYKSVMGIFRDRTQTHLEHERRLNDAKQTEKITREVIEKNMRAVQEIAQLLGESAANTKIALTNLAKTIDKEDGK